ATFMMTTTATNSSSATPASRAACFARATVSSWVLSRMGPSGVLPVMLTSSVNHPKTCEALMSTCPWDMSEKNLTALYPADEFVKNCVHASQNGCTGEMFGGSESSFLNLHKRMAHGCASVGMTPS